MRISSFFFHFSSFSFPLIFPTASIHISFAFIFLNSKKFRQIVHKLYVTYACVNVNVCIRYLKMNCIRMWKKGKPNRFYSLCSASLSRYDKRLIFTHFCIALTHHIRLTRCIHTSVNHHEIKNKPSPNKFLHAFFAYFKYIIYVENNHLVEKFKNGNTKTHTH